MSTSEQQNNAAFLKVRDLTRVFREGQAERSVLRNANLTIDRGEFVVLHGRSGAGKSTLLNIVSGIDTPSTGTVEIGGITVSSLSPKERTLFRRRNIGFVFQSFNLIPTLTVAENILLPIQLDSRKDAAKEKRALDFLDKVGLAERASSFPDVLSGGEQQRVAIARALANEPMLLLADEPTGNLDYETGRQVMDLLHSLVRATSTTMIVVTHDRDFIDSSDHVIELKDGKIQRVLDGEASR